MPSYYVDAAQVPLTPRRPLLITDADEVLLLFADGFDKFLATRGCSFDFVSYHLYGNVRRRSDNKALSDLEVTRLLDEFRGGFDSLLPVDGAQKAIAELSAHLDIVALSNMSASQVAPRLRNFASLGLALPLVINSGPKGSAVKTLAERAGRPVFFVDDIPRHLASALEEVPDVFRIQLVGDERLRPVRLSCEHAHLSADTWEEVAAFIHRTLVSTAG